MRSEDLHMLTALAFLILIASVFHLLLGGGGVARLAVQFPARRRIDSVALAGYFRATDLSRGFALYPLLGAGGPILTWAALAFALLNRAPAEVTLLVMIASILAALHAFTTARAAPTMMRIGRAEDRAEVLGPLIERFVRWSWPRAILQVVTAALLVGAMLAINPVDLALPPPLLAIIVIALGFESVLAGAALDQVVVHLPARRKIGAAAYAAYLQAAEGKTGRALYRLPGAGGVVTVLLALAAVVWIRDPAAIEALLVVALASGSVSLLLSRRMSDAVSQLSERLRNRSSEQLTEEFARGARWRAPFLFLAFGCLIVALALP